MLDISNGLDLCGAASGENNEQNEWKRKPFDIKY
jgi:hypothetical protein